MDLRITHTRCNLNINFQVFSSGPQSVSLVLPVRLAAQAAQAAILFFCDEARTQRTKRNNKKINKRKTSGSSSSSSSSTLYLFS